MRITTALRRTFDHRAIRITAILIALSIAVIFLSSFFLKRFDLLHGVNLTIEKETKQYYDLQQAFNSLPEHTTSPAIISTFVPMEQCNPCVVAFRAPGRTKLWINKKSVLQKGHQWRSIAFITQDPGLNQIRISYESGPRVAAIELGLSYNFQTVASFERKNCYLAKVDANMLQMEHIAAAISAFSRLLLVPLILFIPLYLLLWPKLRTAIGSNPRHAALIAIMLLFFAFLRFHGMTQQLVEGMHPDERLIQNMVDDVHGTGLEPRSFWYTTGYVYSTAALDWLYRWITGSHAVPHFSARILSAFAATISCLLVYLIARKLTNGIAATFAFVIFGLLYMPVYLAHFGIIEPFLVCLFLAAFLSMIYLLDAYSAALIASAGLFTGLAIGTKQTAAILAVPLLLIMIQWIRTGRFKEGIAKPVLIFVITAAAAYMLFAPYTILDFSKFVRYQQRQLGDIGGTSNNALLFVRSGSVPGFHIVMDNIRRGVGLPIVFTAIAGAVFLFRKSIMACLLTAGFAVIYFLILINSSIIPYHYVLLLVPFLSILSGYLLFEATKTRRTVREILIAVGLIAILYPSVQGLVSFEKAISGPDTRRTASAWCYKNLPANTRVDYELFGPRFLLPAFDATAMRLLARQRLGRYLNNRRPQYYIQDSLSASIFVKQGSEVFPRQNEWLKWVESNAAKVAEFHGHPADLHNPDIVIYKLPEPESAQQD